MNNIVAVRKCDEYEIHEVYNLIEEIYKICRGPELKHKKVLIKPNILSDNIPQKCITTHPVIVEAMIRFVQSKGATAVLGDSPAVHFRGFKPERSGVVEVCEKTGVTWIDFRKHPSDLKLRNGRIRIASIAREVDLIISLPKMKNHELVYFTGAVKNTLGLVPGFSKAKQHAFHNERENFSRFLIDLNESLTPHFFLMDGITAMEGHGPAQGNLFAMGVLIGSTNPLALDIIASSIAGYDPNDIPTNRVGLERGKWLTSSEEISYSGPELKSLIKNEFNRIPVSGITNISFKFIKNRIHFLRKLDRRPDFIHQNCTGCKECIKICPEKAIVMHKERDKYVVLSDALCIRCYCCSEVCRYNAVEIRRKLIGA